ncbi:hypothetical protein VN97_g4050 [Penicillium thymicola]|uniref:Uncharacterized protein n=1 Tax=Penicillium thymicola TaxID=293382 RepID=A0AAI9TLA9_PENTH|nr:hypothetical protein VN97_g4050 [Penicillium thymicola]
MLSQKWPLSPSGEPSGHTSKKPEHVTRSILNRYHRTHNLKERKFETMATEIVKSDDLTMDTSESRIGNHEGLAILSRLDALRIEIKELQKRMARSERILDSVRATKYATGT